MAKKSKKTNLLQEENKQEEKNQVDNLVEEAGYCESNEPMTIEAEGVIPTSESSETPSYYNEGEFEYDYELEDLEDKIREYEEIDELHEESSDLRIDAIERRRRNGVEEAVDVLAKREKSMFKDKVKIKTEIKRIINDELKGVMSILEDTLYDQRQKNHYFLSDLKELHLKIKNKDHNYNLRGNRLYELEKELDQKNALLKRKEDILRQREDVVEQREQSMNEISVHYNTYKNENESLKKLITQQSESIMSYKEDIKDKDNQIIELLKDMTKKLPTNERVNEIVGDIAKEAVKGGKVEVQQVNE